MKPLSDRLFNRELISRGDLTLAFRARDSVLDRLVFVKALNPALAKDEEIRARFEREAKAVARLDHPNLVRIYEYGEDPAEGLYMLLEYLEGSTLAGRLEAGDRFTGDALMDLATQLLRGLGALHGVGILHRDMKPENILVRGTGDGAGPVDSNHTSRYKITDFSLAALRDAPRLTHHEAIVGTPAYMSPEQAAGGVPDERSDLYSVGVILYEAATGDNPFVGGTVLDTLRKVREAEPSFDRPEIRALPEKAVVLLQKLLRKDPAERPASASEARRMLGEHVAAEQPVVRSTISRFRYVPLVVLLVGYWGAQKWLHLDTRSYDWVFLFVVVLGFLLARQTRRGVRADAVRARNRKRDMAFLGAALLLVAFWGAMMFWFPWGGKPVNSKLPTTLPANDASIVSPDTTHSTSNADTTSTQPVLRPERSISSLSEPELRAPVQERMPDTGRKRPASGIAVTDSTDLTLTTEPWAHVFWNGTQVGTTPLSAPLRLPSGRQTVVLRNPAYPPVQLTLDLNEPTRHDAVRLADHAALVRTAVEPWGEIYVDGEHMGTAPLATPLFVSPGHHTLRVSHPQLSALQQDFTAAAGDTLAVDADLAHSHIAFKKVR
jgi:hypothetical protein